MLWLEVTVPPTEPPPTVMVVLADALHPPAEAVTVYVVVLAGVAVGFAIEALFSVPDGVHA